MRCGRAVGERQGYASREPLEKTRTEIRRLLTQHLILKSTSCGVQFDASGLSTAMLSLLTLQAKGFDNYLNL